MGNPGLGPSPPEGLAPDSPGAVSGSPRLHLTCSQALLPASTRHQTLLYPQRQSRLLQSQRGQHCLSSPHATHSAQATFAEPQAQELSGAG